MIILIISLKKTKWYLSFNCESQPFIYVTVKISDDATLSNATEPQYVRNKPLFPKPESNFQQSRDKKEFVATYNFIPVEECYLELQQVYLLIF